MTRPRTLHLKVILYLELATLVACKNPPRKKRNQRRGATPRRVISRTVARWDPSLPRLRPAAWGGMSAIECMRISDADIWDSERASPTWPVPTRYPACGLGSVVCDLARLSRAQEIQSRQEIEIGSRLNLTRLPYARLSSAAGPLLLCLVTPSPLPEGSSAESERPHPTTSRSRPSAATPGRLDASSRFLSLRSQLNERTTSVKGCEHRTQSPHCGVGHVYEFVETVAASTCTFLSCRCCGSAVCWSSYSHCLMPRRMPWRLHRARFRVRGGCPHRARLRRPHRARFRVCLLTLTY